MRARWHFLSGAGMPLVATFATVATVAALATSGDGRSGESGAAGSAVSFQSGTDHPSSHGNGICHHPGSHAPACVGVAGGAGSSAGGGSTGAGGGGSGGAGGGGSTDTASGGSTGAGGGGTTTGGGGGGSPPGAPHCYSGAWPVASTPIPPGSAGGVYLRSNSSGMYLEVTHRGGRTVAYSGTLTSDGTLSANSYKLEPDDHFSVSPDGHTLTFRFVNHGALDGTAITTTCGGSVTLTADSEHQPARLVHSGGRSTGQAQRLNAPVTLSRSS